jgi:hypothetical protein
LTDQKSIEFSIMRACAAASRVAILFSNSQYDLGGVKLCSHPPDSVAVSRGELSHQECFMGTVMVKCPDTGHDISTGIVADRASFNATPVFFARVYCPMCQTEHEWFAKEAWVCDSESLATPQWAA